MLKHNELSSAGQVNATKWDQNHKFDEGVLGSMLIRDTEATYGARWVDPSVGFWYSDGDGIPVYRALVAGDIPQLAYSSLSGLPTLGGAASLNVGTSAGTVAAGDHTQSVATGGTAITSYAIGDLLQATGATTLAKLAAVAVGNVLLSGGVTTASAWGKVGLTTHVSGTLPFANGGLGFATLTAGDLLYASATDTLGKLTVGAAGSVLIGGSLPAWSASPTITNVAITTDLYSAAAATATIGATNRFKSARLGGNTVTTSTPVLDIAQTWNASGVSFRGISWAFTETASASGSRYFEILGGAAGTSDEFYVQKGGTVWARAGYALGTDAAPPSFVSFNDDFRVALRSTGGTNLIALQFQTASTGTTSGDGFGIFVLASNVAQFYQYENAAIQFLTNGVQRFAIETTGAIGVQGVAFSALSAPGLGYGYAVVTDSNTATWGASIAGGGSNKVLAFYNGTAWKVAGA